MAQSVRSEARSLAAAALLAALSTPALAAPKCFASPGDTVSGPITHYVDGDTFDIGRDRIRLWGVDAAERGERGYDEATSTLQSLTRGRSLSCVVKYLDKTRDRRCVSLCDVAGSGDLGETLLQSGWVRIRPRYIKEDQAMKPRYEAAEREATNAKRGLWR